jgi:hypothetical protein
MKRRQVFYALEKERNDRTERILLALYPRYVLARADAESIGGAWHHRITRFSLEAA